MRYTNLKIIYTLFVYSWLIWLTDLSILSVFFKEPESMSVYNFALHDLSEHLQALDFMDSSWIETIFELVTINHYFTDTE